LDLGRAGRSQESSRDHGVLAISTPNLTVKDLLLDSGNPAIFTEPHYNGFPAVLVRLALVDLDELEGLLIEAWKCKAPKSEVANWERRV
jgi:hypothetical protein